MTAQYRCVDCGFETDERWLMCPECTTPEDWAQARREVAAGLASAPSPAGTLPLGQTGDFTCPRCGMTSHNPNDKREGYCGNCHDWTGKPCP